MMRTTLASVAFALGPTLLAPPNDGPRSVAISVRPLEAQGLKVELEFRNLTDAPLDNPVYLELMLHGPDGAASGREQSTLHTSVDPATGQFGGYYADRSTVRLQLRAGQVRAIKIDLDKLKWSLGWNWNWTPRDLWEMAEAGNYELSVDFAITGPPDKVERMFAGPVKLRIVGQ